MAYCVTADLLLGQLETRLPPEVDPLEYIGSAADHIDARLGSMYATPFEVEGINALPSWQVKLLKGMNAKRASGQIILAVTLATEDSLVHQYGLWLIQEADTELAAITSGQVVLSAPAVDSDGLPVEDIPDPDDLDPYARVPTASNIDMYSATAAFEARVMQGDISAVYTPRDGQRYGYVPTPRGH